MGRCGGGQVVARLASVVARPSPLVELVVVASGCQWGDTNGVFFMKESAGGVFSYECLHLFLVRDPLGNQSFVTHRDGQRSFMRRICGVSAYFSAASARTSASVAIVGESGSAAVAPALGPLARLRLRLFA